jgi:multiple sugar transport system permease protein
VSRRAFRIAVLAAAALGAAGVTGWAGNRGFRAQLAARRAVADSLAAVLRGRVRPGRPLDASLAEAVRAAGLAHGLTVTVRPGGGESQPREDTRATTVPLRDADDWDAVGSLEVASLPGRQPGRLPGGGTEAATIVFAALGAGWLLRWDARTSERRRRETLAAWSFLGVPFLHLLVFSLAPVLFTIYLSFHDWDLLRGTHAWVGLANYRDLAGDGLFFATLRNTALYVLYVPITMAAALALALWLNRSRRGERLLRAVVFLPYVTSTVAIAIVWQWMFNPDFGIVNTVLGVVGIRGADWLGDPRTAMAALIIVTVWTQVGYQMTVLLAGLQGIPQTYLDAATMDGASPWQRFRHVTLPLLKPVLLFVLVTGIIGGFQVFTLVYLMTEGGPLHSTDVIVYRIYQTAWEFLRFGSASAMAVVLFVLLLGLTWVQFRLLGARRESP